MSHPTLLGLKRAREICTGFNAEASTWDILDEIDNAIREAKQAIAAQSAPDEREAVTMQQVLTAYEYATEHPHKYLRGTTNWCAAFAHSLNEQLGAAWQRAQSAPVVPEGWRLVPVEPTPEMWEAGAMAKPRVLERRELEGGGLCITSESIEGATWRAMLAAAPQPARSER